MKYYTCAYTSSGFIDLTNENIDDTGTKIELKGSNSHITDLILRLAVEYKGKCEEIYNAGTKDLLSGIISREDGIAIVSNLINADKVINLDNYFGVPEYNPKTKYLFECMYSSFYEAKKIHDKWEKIYIENMNFDRLSEYGTHIIKNIVSTKSATGSGKNYKRFFGTITDGEAVNFIDELTEDINKRYFIKGRPGTGKSTFLKKFSKALKENGFDVEEYYCSFDKESLDMVVSRELSCAVFDSTPPHEKFPQRESDEILDFYINSGLEGTDEKYKDQLVNLKASYDLKIKEGKSFFKIAKELKEASEKQMLSKVKDDDLAQIIKNIFN